MTKLLEDQQRMIDAIQSQRELIPAEERDAFDGLFNEMTAQGQREHKLNQDHDAARRVRILEDDSTAQAVRKAHAGLPVQHKIKDPADGPA